MKEITKEQMEDMMMVEFRSWLTANFHDVRKAYKEYGLEVEEITCKKNFISFARTVWEIEEGLIY